MAENKKLEDIEEKLNDFNCDSSCTEDEYPLTQSVEEAEDSPPSGKATAEPTKTSPRPRGAYEIFPWLKDVHQAIRSNLKAEYSQKYLLAVMNKCIKYIKTDILNYLRLPNKSLILSKHLTRLLFLFKELNRNFDDSTEYLLRMCELLAYYTQLELRHSVKFEEPKQLVANRISLHFDILLQGAGESYILRIFLHLKSFFQQKEIMRKLFEKYLKKPRGAQKELPDKLYVMYLISFKLWKTLEDDKDEQIKIEDYANSFMKPKSTLRLNPTYAPFIPAYQAKDDDATRCILSLYFNPVMLIKAVKKDEYIDSTEKSLGHIVDLSISDDVPDSAATNCLKSEIEKINNLNVFLNKSIVKLEKPEIVATIDLTVEEKIRAKEISWLEDLRRKARASEPVSIPTRCNNSQQSNIVAVIELDDDEDETGDIEMIDGSKGTVAQNKGIIPSEEISLGKCLDEPFPLENKIPVEDNVEKKIEDSLEENVERPNCIEKISDENSTENIKSSEGAEIPTVKDIANNNDISINNNESKENTICDKANTNLPTDDETDTNQSEMEVQNLETQKLVIDNVEDTNSDESNPEDCNANECYSLGYEGDTAADECKALENENDTSAGECNHDPLFGSEVDSNRTLPDILATSADNVSSVLTQTICQSLEEIPEVLSPTSLKECINVESQTENAEDEYETDTYKNKFVDFVQTCKEDLNFEEIQNNFQIENQEMKKNNEEQMPSIGVLSETENDIDNNALTEQYVQDEEKLPTAVIGKSTADEVLEDKTKSVDLQLKTDKVDSIEEETSIVKNINDEVEEKIQSEDELSDHCKLSDDEDDVIKDIAKNLSMNPMIAKKTYQRKKKPVVPNFNMLSIPPVKDSTLLDLPAFSSSSSEFNDDSRDSNSLSIMDESEQIDDENFDIFLRKSSDIDDIPIEKISPSKNLPANKSPNDSNVVFSMSSNRKVSLPPPRKELLAQSSPLSTNVVFSTSKQVIQKKDNLSPFVHKESILDDWNITTEDRRENAFEDFDNSTSTSTSLLEIDNDEIASPTMEQFTNSDVIDVAQFFGKDSMSLPLKTLKDTNYVKNKIDSENEIIDTKLDVSDEHKPVPKEKTSKMAVTFNSYAKPRNEFRDSPTTTTSQTPNVTKKKSVSFVDTPQRKSTATIVFPKESIILEKKTYIKPSLITNEPLQPWNSSINTYSNSMNSNQHDLTSKASCSPRISVRTTWPTSNASPHFEDTAQSLPLTNRTNKWMFNNIYAKSPANLLKQVQLNNSFRNHFDSKRVSLSFKTIARYRNPNVIKNQYTEVNGVRIKTSDIDDKVLAVTTVPLYDICKTTKFKKVSESSSELKLKKSEILKKPSDFDRYLEKKKLTVKEGIKKAVQVPLKTAKKLDANIEKKNSGRRNRITRKLEGAKKVNNIDATERQKLPHIDVMETQKLNKELDVMLNTKNKNDEVPSILMVNPLHDEKLRRRAIVQLTKIAFKEKYFRNQIESEKKPALSYCKKSRSLDDIKNADNNTNIFTKKFRNKVPGIVLQKPGLQVIPRRRSDSDSLCNYDGSNCSANGGNVSGVLFKIYKRKDSKLNEIFNKIFDQNPDNKEPNGKLYESSLQIIEPEKTNNNGGKDEYCEENISSSNNGTKYQTNSNLLLEDVVNNISFTKSNVREIEATCSSTLLKASEDEKLKNDIGNANSPLIANENENCNKFVNETRERQASNLSADLMEDDSRFSITAEYAESNGYSSESGEDARRRDLGNVYATGYESQNLCSGQSTSNVNNYNESEKATAIAHTHNEREEIHVNNNISEYVSNDNEVSSTTQQIRRVRGSRRKTIFLDNNEFISADAMPISKRRKTVHHESELNCNVKDNAPTTTTVIDPPKKKRGRPKGSKNKVRVVETAPVENDPVDYARCPHVTQKEEVKTNSTIVANRESDDEPLINLRERLGFLDNTQDNNTLEFNRTLSESPEDLNVNADIKQTYSKNSFIQNVFVPPDIEQIIEAEDKVEQQEIQTKRKKRKTKPRRFGRQTNKSSRPAVRFDEN